MLFVRLGKSFVELCDPVATGVIQDLIEVQEHQ